MSEMDESYQSQNSESYIFEFDKYEREDFPESDVFSHLRALHNNTYTLTNDIYDNSIFIVRISGCQFADVFKYINSDEQLIRDCFIETTKDLVEYYNAQCGWTMGDDILLFFDYNEHIDEWMVLDTENVMSTIGSRTTMKFDRYINTIVDKLVEKYNVEIVNDILDQDYIFRSVLLIPDDPEDALEYIDYMIWRKTEHIELGCENYGTIVKPCIFENDSGCIYKKMSCQDANTFLTLGFLMTPYITIFKDSVEDENTETDDCDNKHLGCMCRYSTDVIIEDSSESISEDLCEY